jgi:micrococcal nuclease
MAEQQPAPPSPMPVHQWVYPARAVRAVDGDTVDVYIDQGMHSLRLERLRLLNVNTPERKTTTFVEGEASRHYTAVWLGLEDENGVPIMRVGKTWHFLIETHKSDAFGRYLALVWRVSDGRCLNDDLIADGMARVDIR